MIITKHHQHYHHYHLDIDSFNIWITRRYDNFTTPLDFNQSQKFRPALDISSINRGKGWWINWLQNKYRINRGVLFDRAANLPDNDYGDGRGNGRELRRIPSPELRRSPIRLLIISQDWIFKIDRELSTQATKGESWRPVCWRRKKSPFSLRVNGKYLSRLSFSWITTTAKSSLILIHPCQPLVLLSMSGVLWCKSKDIIEIQCTYSNLVSDQKALNIQASSSGTFKTLLLENCLT